MLSQKVRAASVAGALGSACSELKALEMLGPPVCEESV